MTLKIIYQDSHYVAIDKPAGLLVHRSPLAKNETVFALQLLRDQIGQAVYPCHRLDRPTSGVLLFALDEKSLRFTQDELAAQRCDKVYHAVVRGWTDPDGTIDYALKNEEAPQKHQSAQTAYRTLARSTVPVPVGPYPEARFSRVELRPKTGRKHQLRRHMAHLRHPILGDTRHGDGAQNRFLRTHCGCQKLMLRAQSLVCTHSMTGQRLHLNADRDAVFETVLQKLSLQRNPLKVTAKLNNQFTPHT